MIKIALAALAASAALIAVPASAQTASGDITITGSVAPKCLVVTGGTPAGTSFSGTIALGELSNEFGVLRTDLEGDFDTAAAAIDIQVVCTSANPHVTVDADAIEAQTATAVDGYADRIDYTATVTFDLTPSGTAVVANDSENDAAPTGETLTSRLASGATNIHIDGSDFRTANLTDLLVADTDYEGHILITVAPAA